MSLDLTDHDRATLRGDRGEAARLAMRIVVELGEALAAPRLVDVTRAHVDGCLYHGEAGLEFAERLLAAGARVTIPTTLNVGLLDLIHPERVRADDERARNARRLMDAYVAMGCRPTFTCAPYQLEDPPALGEQIAWAESNAIVFANSVLGARTERYGDFIDVCCAIVGRAPFVGLHTDEGRRARLVFRLEGLPARLRREEVLGSVLGHIVGGESGSQVPAIVGLGSLGPDEVDARAGSLVRDQLKALGAAAASSGSVPMFHAIGLTPEAPTLDAALGGEAPERELVVSAADLRAARDELTDAAGGSPIAAASVGTPHASEHELARLLDLVEQHGRAPAVPLYVNVDRRLATDRAGWAARLEPRGITLVSDTCTYLAPIMGDLDGPVITSSAKWAWYAPANLGVRVVLGSLEECVRSAVLGRLWRDEELWGG